jgi:hypothetical protein
MPIVDQQRLAEVDPVVLLRAGGWSLDHASLVHVQQVGDEALVLVDGTGDGRPVTIEVWRSGSDGWQPCGSTDAGALDGDGSSTAFACGRLLWRLGPTPGMADPDADAEAPGPIAIPNSGLWVSWRTWHPDESDAAMAPVPTVAEAAAPYWGRCDLAGDDGTTSRAGELGG